MNGGAAQIEHVQRKVAQKLRARAMGLFQDVAQIEEFLSADLRTCGQAAADVTFSGGLTPSFTSPANYAAGKNGCPEAYFADLNDYSPFHATNRIIWGSNPPPSRNACEAATIEMRLFKKVPAPGLPESMGLRRAWGTWGTRA